METNPSPAPLPSSPAESDARLWNALCHLISLTGLLTFVGFILGPLLVWLIQRDKYPSVDQHGKESMNLQISVLIYQVGLVVFGIVGGFVTCGIGVRIAGILSLLLFATSVILVIIASMQAWSGGFYLYPYILRLIK